MEIKPSIAPNAAAIKSKSSKSRKKKTAKKARATWASKQTKCSKEVTSEIPDTEYADKIVINALVLVLGIVIITIYSIYVYITKSEDESALIYCIGNFTWISGYMLNYIYKSTH